MQQLSCPTQSDCSNTMQTVTTQCRLYQHNADCTSTTQTVPTQCRLCQHHADCSNTMQTVPTQCRLLQHNADCTKTMQTASKLQIVSPPLSVDYRQKVHTIQPDKQYTTIPTQTVYHYPHRVYYYPHTNSALLFPHKQCTTIPTQTVHYYPHANGALLSPH